MKTILAPIDFSSGTPVIIDRRPPVSRYPRRPKPPVSWPTDNAAWDAKESVP
jgi:hypothetical protein